MKLAYFLNCVGATERIVPSNYPLNDIQILFDMIQHRDPLRPVGNNLTRVISRDTVLVEAYPY